MDNPETLATLGTQDIGQINVRENRRGNQEWTIQRHWQTKQKPQHRKLKRWATQTPPKSIGGGGVVVKKTSASSRFSWINHSTCWRGCVLGRSRMILEIACVLQFIFIQPNIFLWCNIWWRLFPKSVVHTKIDIYVIIITDGKVNVKCNCQDSV
jgi:hypothetical protein